MNYIIFLIPLFFLIVTIEYVYADAGTRTNISESLEAILLSYLALLAFKDVMKHEVFRRLANEPFFYLNAGIILYFLGSLTYFAFANYLVTVEGIALASSAGVVHSILNSVANFTMALGYYKLLRR